MRAIALLWAMGLVAVVGASANAQAPTPSADDVFAAARHVWLQQQYPAYLDYDVAISVNDGGVEKTERYTSAFDATDNTVWVDPVSDWEIAHPAVVKGMNLNFALPFVSKQLNKPMPPEDFLNVPMLAPAYSFGIAPFVAMSVPHKPTPEELVAAVRAQFHDPNPRAELDAATVAAPAPASGLKTIATVSAAVKHYTITLLGNETIGGHDCFHLALQPVTEAHTYRLRDLWVDRSDYRTWQLNEAYNFKSAPGSDVPWTVTFADIGGAQYASVERADAPISTSGLIFTQATIAFENIRARTTPVAAMRYAPAQTLTEP